LFSELNIKNAFLTNHIIGPVIYEYEREINSSSQLGKRLNHYEKIFGINLNKKGMWMPEDCIQFLSMEKNIFGKFLDTWDKCIEIKYKDKLSNVPAGNIDEMCFSAVLNGVGVGNNSDKSVNILTANHDIWYR
jgi:hypothetical protein